MKAMSIMTKACISGEPNQREQENLRLAYEAACESMVLMKNDGSLPLQTKKVALYGSGVSRTIKGGTGSGEVNERHAVSILEGMRDRGFEISSGGWLEDYERDLARAQAEYKIEKRKRVNLLKPNSIMSMLFDNFRFPCGRAITEADVVDSATDSCIYVLARQAGEGGDRRLEAGDYYLTDAEREAISFCAAHYPHFILVINSGAPVDTGFLNEIDGINAVVYMSQLGSEGGHAFADLISGDVTPSGKLADSWAKKYEDIPYALDYSYLNGELSREDYREGIYVGYRYFDTFGVEPAFAFGFGLSYTSFSLETVDVTVQGRDINLTVKVTNTGAVYGGKETVQLYISAPAGTLHKEYQALAAFEKTELLAPGESRTLTLSVDLTSMASYRTSESCYVLEPGEYILRLGNSSRNTAPVGVVSLAEEVVVSRHTEVCPLQEPMEELQAAECLQSAIPEGIPRLTVDCSAVETVTCSYEEYVEPISGRTRDFVSKLDLNELAEIVVGIGMFGGEKQFNLPGSVGNTTSKFWPRGLANVALCDGPAGLRIQRRSALTDKGKIKPLDLAMSVFEAFPNFVKRHMKGDAAKDTVLYQYTTAFPVAAALAQTWNTKLLERIGDGIYREMKEYGCTYWLAPAVNIHRNPLCGRHFEYFSEDPRLSGELAAALTRGVQKEDGFYVTVKHFACNNQEENRNEVSSNVGERALREIYLKPFEIAVRKGHAKGIMTSYNRINGVYAPNSRDLCTKVLRNEWGFTGVVMTDWFSTAKGRGDSALAMWAGNDLIMPGTKSAKKEIVRAVRSGRIAEADVRRCCARVVQSIFDSAIQREYVDAKE